MQVFFYLPEKYLPDASRQEAWKSGTITTLEEGGKIASAQSWIYQTWLLLEQSGCVVALTHTPPEEGILVTLSGCVGDSYRPGPGLFFADIVADGLPHPAAHLHLVQNAIHARKLPRSIYTPHWPHPNLIPRNEARGERFENMGFYGDASNLAKELSDPAWQERLRAESGLNLQVLGAGQWHDYRETDCVLAVRGFGPRVFLRKPATKLYNAWLAGVPFIGGSDSAYVGDGTPGTDYLAATSPEEIIAQARRLREDAALRNAVVTAGSRKAEQFSRPAGLARWRRLVTGTLPEAAAAWEKRSRLSKKIYLVSQTANAWVDQRLRG